MAIPSQPPSPEQATRRLSADDLVVIVFAFFGLAGSIFLVLLTTAPPIMISLLLATGIAAFVYKFLGGIQGASIVVGTLKLGGTMAALVGLALIINPRLEESLALHLINDEMLLGQWRWVYARGGWEGHLVFTKDGKGQLQFTGSESEWINKVDGTKEEKHLFDLKNGKAWLTRRRELRLETDVHDYKYNRDFRLVGTAPLILVPAFRGDLRQEPGSPTDQWGMMIYKWPPNQ
jgi:hypothetical protein